MLHKKGRIATTLATVIAYYTVQGQVSVLNNTVLGPTDYVGCDGLSSQPLRFTTTLNYQHQWRTNNILRMRLWPDDLAGTINGYTPLDLSGFLGIGPFTSAGTGLVTRPFAMLHAPPDLIAHNHTRHGVALPPSAWWIRVER